MYILDTNHFSALERRGSEAERLTERLSAVDPESIFVTVISFEEQMRGWAAALGAASKGAITAAPQVPLYARLQTQLDNYCNLSVLPFDADAAARFDALRTAHRRASAPDLKIAAITLERRAILLTRNERDFRDIPMLTVEDWTR